MAQFIVASDLAGLMPAQWDSGQVQSEIDAALGWVRVHVRCLDTLDDHGMAVVNAVLRKAVPYNGALATSGGAGPVTQVNTGPFAYTSTPQTPRDSGAYFSPAQVAALSGLCAGRRFAGTIRTRPL